MNAPCLTQVLAAFRRDTTAHAAFLERDTGLIHGDANEHNLLVRRRDDGGDGYDVCGVIDLGDCHAAPRVFEVALNASYMAMASGDVGTVGDVLAGYCERRPLAAEAIDLLRVREARLHYLCLAVRAFSLSLHSFLFPVCPRSAYVHACARAWSWD